MSINWQKFLRSSLARNNFTMAEQVFLFLFSSFILTLLFYQRLRRHTKSKIFSLMRNLVVRWITWTLAPVLTCILGGKKIATKEKRWYKDVGLGFKTPSEAINGTYIGAWSMYVICCLLIMNWNFRQKMPFHWRHLNSRSYPYGQGCVYQNESNHHYPSWLPTLHSKIQYVVVCCFFMAYLILLSDRYEKRHKNMAVHLSPAFRVELGDVVTVGTSSCCAICEKF